MAVFNSFVCYYCCYFIYHSLARSLFLGSLKTPPPPPPPAAAAPIPPSIFQPSKALATGLHLLASRRNNIAAATLATSGNGIGVDIEGGMLESRSAVGNSDGVRNERGERDGSESLRCEEEAAVTDAFFGVDLLREAFESALRGPSAG